MTYPDFQNQQAAHRAQQAAQQAYYHSRSPGRMGVFGLLGRLVGLVITLVIIAFALGIFLMVLGRADPDLFNHIKSWIDGLF